MVKLILGVKVEHAAVASLSIQLDGFCSNKALWRRSTFVKTLRLNLVSSKDITGRSLNLVVAERVIFEL